MESKVGGSRILVIIAGLILGAILGMWIYGFEGMFLAFGPWWEIEDNKPPPEEIRTAFFADVCWYGLSSGLIVGFIAGLVFPFLSSTGHMAKSIGCTLFLVITPLVWWTQGHNLAYMGAGFITLSVLGTLIVFLFTIPISGFFGSVIEPLLKEKGIRIREEA